MKSIAIFVSTLGAGGAEKQAALLASILQKRYDVFFVALYGDKDKSDYVMSILQEAHVNVYPLEGPWLKKMCEYAKILRDNNVEIAFNYLTMMDFWGAIVEKLFGVKTIWNGIRNSDLEGWKTILERIGHNYVATGTIFNCYSGEETFKQRGLMAKKCVTIPNCFPEISESIIRETGKVRRIITVGRFVPQKDYETAIKTISELKKLCDNFVYDICGYGGMEEKIRDWVKQYEVEDIVEFHIKPNNIPHLLKNADVYLCTSLFEGTSNSIMEALNWSLPVVATNVGDNNQLVKDGENGKLHQVGDAKGMASSLSHLLNNAHLRNIMGINANRHLREKYSMDIFERRYVSLIENGKVLSI